MKVLVKRPGTAMWGITAFGADASVRAYACDACSCSTCGTNCNKFDTKADVKKKNVGKADVDEAASC